jgi:hypothetical protein
MNDVSPVLDTARLVGAFSNVVVDTEFESVDTLDPLTDRTVIGEYVVKDVSPVTDTGLAVTPVFTEMLLTYTV